MDTKLREWGMRPARAGVPRLWLFTDLQRLADPLPAASRLPRGRAGIVFRHDGAPERERTGRALARICRQRRLILVVAGDVRLAARLGAGVHLRGGRWPDALRRRGYVTSSAHSVPELIRARRNRAVLAFLSPAFPTASHAGAPGLGPLRWGLVAKRAPQLLRLGALGGITGQSLRRLPGGWCAAAGAIGGLS